MDDLIAFLRARLDEDERLARDWQGARLVLTEQAQNDPRRQHVRPFRERVTDAQRAEYRYGDRFDPARMLREVEAKRKIIDRASDWTSNEYEAWPVLAMLALPYSDHPDYQAEEWKP